MREGDDYQHQGGRELGWDDMANPCEPLINVVRFNKPKGLRGLDQKGKWTGGGVSCSPPADVVPPADRRSLSHLMVLVWNVVSPYLSRQGKRTGRRAPGGAGKGRGKKRRPSCRGVERG